MKKIILTFIILIFNINLTYAGSCLIEDSTSPALLKYIENNRKIIREITSQTSKSNETSPSSELLSNITKIYNDISNVSWYWAYFTYYVAYPLSNEVPHEIKRDHDLLVWENEWLSSYLETIIDSKKSNIDIDLSSVCNEIGYNCDFWNSQKNTEIIRKLIANNDKILELYRYTFMWLEDEADNSYKYILVPSNFKSEISTNYSKSWYSWCSEQNWWFFERISESIWNIALNNQKAKDWISEWKESWALLMWTNSDSEEYQKLEKELLKKELSRQWVSWDSQTNMLDTLSKYNNEGWYSLNNNFITNTYNNALNEVKKVGRVFSEEIIWDFFSSYNDDENIPDPEVSLGNINTATYNSETTQDVKLRIHTMYENQIIYDWISELSTINTRTKIIDSYISIKNSIWVLNSACPISVAICNAQDSGNWNCWKCN